MKPALLLALATVALPCLADPSGQGLRRDGHDLVTPQGIAFQAGSAEPGADNAADLALVGDYLKKQPAISLLRVEGHVTSAADANRRLALSQQRAVAVARQLVAQGVACERLLPVGFGDSKPRGPHGDPGNERIQFVHAALRNRPIGGMPVDGGGLAAEWVCSP